MAKNVKTIPATLNRFTSVPKTAVTKRKVCAYARVSTDHEEQLTSYAAQVDYYTNYIKNHSEWEFVKVYSDEGVTGCNTKHRIGFAQMVADALDGKINLIITKSVSRFARNTVDSLTTIRTLKEHGVEVYFEKENIWTFDSKGELLLSIMSSISQEESRSISENVTWGQRKRFADGKVSVPFGRFLGYDKGKNGELVVNPEQAVIVRRIYAEFLKGKSPYQIAKELTADGIPTPGGKTKWCGSVVRSILTNEKYKGDALLQKVYTPDFLTKKKVKNSGQVPQYYVQDDHEAIIEPEIFDLVQQKIQKRQKREGRVSIFSGKIRCGCCDGFYGSKVWHSNDKYRKVVWQCNHKFEGQKCTTPHFSEDEIRKLFVKAVNQLVDCKKEILSLYSEIADTKFSTEEQEKTLTVLSLEIQSAEQQIQDCIEENAAAALNQSEYTARYDALIDRYDVLKTKYEKLAVKVHEKQCRKEQLLSFLRWLERTSLITEFDENIWNLMLDDVIVHSKSDVVFIFNNGSEISVSL